MFADAVVSIPGFLIDRREVTCEEFRSVFPGYVGPLDGADDEPARGVSFDHAVAFAEAVGMNLPTYWEYIWAATNRGTTNYSWGSAPPEIALEAIAREPSAFRDVTPTEPPIYDLILGLGEWTETSRPGIQLAPPELNLPGSFIPGDINDRMIYGAFPRLGDVDLSQATCPTAFQIGLFEQATRSLNNTGFRCLRRSPKQ
jgi:formylglycine-generating enzyme required for sulfatase activity